MIKVARSSSSHRPKDDQQRRQQTGRQESAGEYGAASPRGSLASEPCGGIHNLACTIACPPSYAPQCGREKRTIIRRPTQKPRSTPSPNKPVEMSKVLRIQCVKPCLSMSREKGTISPTADHPARHRISQDAQYTPPQRTACPGQNRKPLEEADADRRGPRSAPQPPPSVARVTDEAQIAAGPEQVLL